MPHLKGRVGTGVLIRQPGVTPGSAAQLVGTSGRRATPRLCIYGQRERGGEKGGDRRGGDNYLEVYGESIAICYVPIKNKDPTIFFCTNRLWKHKFKIKPLESSLSRGLNKHQSSVILLDIFLQTIY